jgi:F0F1-type ATP synthase membrane subunit b/b'
MKTFCRRMAVAFAGWLLVLGCATAPAFAADDAAPDPTTTPVGLVFRWINFLVVAGGVAYVLVKIGGPYFRGEAQAVSKSIREAADTKAAAEREVAQADQKLAHLQGEIEGLRQTANQEAVAETERIRTATRAESEKIAKAAQAEITASERAGQQEIRAIAARLATERAASLLGQRMTPATQAALFQSFVAKLEKSTS